MTYPVVSTDPAVQALYLKIRRNLAADAKRKGDQPSDVADHRFAEMLALRSPPRSMTDREFFEGRGTLADQFKDDEYGLQKLVQAAQANGYTPSAHDFYCEPIADRPGDPKAFIKPSDGRGHVKRVLEERGWESRGAINVKGTRSNRDPIKNPAIKLGEDIVQAEAKKIAKAEPGKKHDARELRERVIEKHSLKL